MIIVDSKYLNMLTEDQSHVLVRVSTSVIEVYRTSEGYSQAICQHAQYSTSMCVSTTLLNY